MGLVTRYLAAACGAAVVAMGAPAWAAPPPASAFGRIPAVVDAAISPNGQYAAGNLTGFCTRHHRGKHQAPGWQYDQSEDGTLTVRTPTGLTASTTPPPF